MKFDRIALVLFSICLGCSGAEQDGHLNQTYVFDLAFTFDSLPPIPHDNALTEARIALGKQLFFDKRLSADGNTSCASCHKPPLAYADTVAISPGVHGRFDFRNSPSLLNVAYQKALFREGGIPSLELQVLSPFMSEGEMDLNLRDIQDILAADQAINSLSLEAYGEEISPLIMAKALAAFQRSLLSSGSAYDRFMAGDSAALLANARRGMDIFFSEATSCSSCHSGFLFTDQQYSNIGLYTEYKDEGRGRLTMKPNDFGKMKTPGLRNVAITAPYMHDGSVATIDEVLEHYNIGGKAHANKDSRVRALNLSDGELMDLKAFLFALTDDALLPTSCNGN